ncbi:MAG: hypothetical protein OHK0039_39060 [Bacteroidia bacterium]
MRKLLVQTLFSISLFAVPLIAAAQPSGFSNVAFMAGWDLASGLTFDENGIMYVWEKGGRVWVVENGVKRATPLIDISDEVGNWRDFGLMGFALDPSYQTNGHIYLLYVVDRHHLLYHGTPAYNPAADEYYNATIGRLTKYTVTNPGNPATAVANLATRQILLGANIDDGIPILHQSHGVGALIFGQDETLLISAGDGASYFGADVGGPDHGTFAAQGVVDGIISPEQNVGSYRSQMLDSYNGRVMRLDKNTGAGLPSNPFYDAGDPFSPRSRTWALGFRNPCRISLKPGTGSSNPANGNPGVIMVGDVGWYNWEEMNIITQGGQNFGWPVFEGMEKHAEYDAITTYSYENPTPNGCGQPYYQFEQLLVQYSATPSWPDVCNPGQQIDNSNYKLFVHRRPTMTWHHNDGSPNQTKIIRNNNIVDLGTNGSTGTIFSGNASIAGTWYTGNLYPASYQNAYFHCDYGELWIRVFKFDNNYEITSVENFQTSGTGRTLGIYQHPTSGELYYMRYGAEIRRLLYSPSGNQVPTAVIVEDTLYTAGNSLQVQFTGSQSTDPENLPLNYLWNFGDGATSTQANPSHLFSTGNTAPTTFTVTLTVTDQGGLSAQATTKIFLRNTPPVIVSTSLDGVDFYSVIEDAVVPLNAVVTDAEHGPAQLTYAWQASLHHDSHTHDEPVDYNESTSAVISAIGCDGPTYFYRIYLTVTDAEGLATEMYKDILPRCAPLVNKDEATYVLGQTLEIPVFVNDLSEDPLDQSSFVFKSLPASGNVSYNSTTGIVTYVQNGSPALSDEFTYQVSDVDGDTSAIGTVKLNWVGPPRVTILTPTAGSKQDNKAMKMRYSINGDSTLIGNMQVILDNGTPELLTDLSSGKHFLFDLSLGAHSVRLQLLEAGTAAPLSFPESADTVAFTAIQAGADIKLQMGIVENVGTSWITVTLDSVYTQMVVVATPVLPNQAALPVVTRIRNVSTNSFQLRVQNPSGSNVSGISVHYIAVEAGTYTLADDGIKMEAVRFSSTRTGSIVSWPKEIRSYNQAYISPVVLCQVMTANDANWSVAYASSNDRDVAPNDQKLFVSKHVASDNNAVRANETVGCIIFEAGETVVRGHPLTARLGFEGVLGVDNSATGYQYTLQGIEDPAVAVLSSAGMNSAEGGWPVLFGGGPTGNILSLAIDEDQIADAERSHGAEQVAYLVIDNVPTPPAPPTFPVELTEFQAIPDGDQVLLKWTTATESNNSFFTVERSKDGLAFQEALRVPGAGNSQQAITYRDIDREPFAGISYYRLRQTDFDGTFTYSHVVEVYIDGAVVNVFPNPGLAGQPVWLEFHLPDLRTADIQLVDAAGRTVLAQRLVMTKPEMMVALPVEALPSGTYFLHITGNNKAWVRKVLIGI